MKNQKIYNGISKTAWGYFFLYFNININQVSILPAFVGYLLFLSAIELLKEKEQELSLLRPLGVIMALWMGAAWLASFANISLEGRWQFADVLIGLVNLYFHFQLLTNLASIARKYQLPGAGLDIRILHYRTLQTVMLTIIELLLYIQPWIANVWTVISVFIVLAYIIAGICIMRVLFALRKYLA